MRALLWLAVAAELAGAAAPPAAWTPEQVKSEREWDALWRKAQREWEAGRRAEAIATMTEARDLTERVHGPTSWLAYEDSSLLARWEGERGGWAAEAAHRRAMLRAISALYGERHWRAVDERLALAEALAQPRRTEAQRRALRRATALNEQAMGLHRAGKAAEALPLYKEALALREEALGERHPDYAISLNNLAMLLKDTGDYKSALPLFEKASAAIKGSLGARHPHYATSLNNLAILLQAMGDNGAALALHKEALAIRKEALGKRHPSYATSLNNLATLLKDTGSHKEALPLLEEALPLIKHALGERHPNYATALNNLASLLQAMGDHGAALPLSRQALTLTGEALGKRHPAYATNLNNLALLLKDMGDHRGALPLFKEALALSKAALGVRHPSYANSLHNLAGLHEAMGDHEGALRLYKEALARTREALGSKHPDTADTLVSLASLHHALGDYRAAFPLFMEALDIHEGVLRKKHPHYYAALGDLAALLFDMGDHKGALPLFKEALALSEGLGKRHPVHVTCLNNLARLRHAMRDYKGALPLYKEALALRKEAVGPTHPDYATSLNNLAMLLKDMGDHGAALPLAEGALSLNLAYLRDVASVQSDRQQLAALSLHRHRLDNLLSIRDGEGRAASAEHVLAWKGSLLLRQQRRRLFLRLSRDPGSAAAAARLEGVTRALAALRSSPTATKERLDQLREEQDEAQAELSKLSAAFRATRERERVTPGSLAKALPEGAVLIDYLFYHDRLTAFVLRRGRTAVRVDLGRAAPVEEAVREWRPLLTRGKDGRVQSAVLRRLIWAPLEKHLEGTKVVLISPDGVLGTVPFAALPGKRSGSYLIEDIALAAIPAPSALPELLSPAWKEGRLPPSLLVASDLRYDPDGGAKAPPAGADDRSGPRDPRQKFVRLAETATEGLAVRVAFEKLFKGGRATVLSEGEATKSAVRKALAEVRYAHLATHGFFAPETARNALAHGGKARHGERAGVTGWHPLLLSGLALSDANREPKGGEEDGILTALEVSEMDLTKLELAVLSACETGLGKIAGGEGLLGMQRAFAAAGARSVIASLWQVDDRATRALIGDFYRAAWGKEVISRAEALRLAQMSMLREGVRRGVVKELEAEKGTLRAPPYYWAAFVLSGDWR